MQSPCKKKYKDSEKPRKNLIQIMREDSMLIVSTLNSWNLSQNFLTCDEFQQILTECSISSSELEIAEFLNRYGKNNQILIESLKRVIAPAVVKSKSITMSPSKRPFIVEKSILDKSTDTSLQTTSVNLNSFFASLENRLKTPDLILEYFFLNRNEKVTQEEFLESCYQLLSSEIDFILIFSELADKNLMISREKFSGCLENYERAGNNEVVSMIRSNLKKKFRNFAQAFESLQKSGVVCSIDLVSTFGPGSRVVPLCLPVEFSKYEFKKFWYSKENLCRVDFCTEKVQEFEVCDSHFKGFILRGEETLRKISVSVAPEKCIEVISGLLTSLNKGTPLSYQNIQKRDVQALQMYLRYKQEKRGLSLSNTPC
jgi:hypothetical protein